MSVDWLRVSPVTYAEDTVGAWGVGGFAANLSHEYSFPRSPSMWSDGGVPKVSGTGSAARSAAVGDVRSQRKLLSHNCTRVREVDIGPADDGGASIRVDWPI